MAEVHFRGVITNDPALAFTPQGGTAQLKLRVAENHSYYDKDRQEWKQTGTTWRDLTFWGKKAEDLDGAFHKNDFVAVSGKEESREWETKDREKRTSLGMRDPLVGVIPKPNQSGGRSNNFSGNQGNQQGGGFNNGGGYSNSSPSNQQGGFGDNQQDWGAPAEEPPF